MKTSRLIALAYLLIALPGLWLIAAITPPFQNADEPAHLMRADQISHLGFLPQRLPDGEQGGWVESGLMRAATPFDPIRFHAEVKTAPAMYAPQGWGTLAPAGFPNTAIYPPVLYLPQAASLLVARAWPLTVLQGLTLARLTAGLATILVATTAIWLSLGGAIWLYAVMLLPMSLALTASASQDGLILACTALAASLAHRLRSRASLASLAAATPLFVLVACARPPYAAFAGVLCLANLSWRPRLLAVGAVLAATLGWCAVAAPHVVLPVFPHGAANPAAQAIFLLHKPLRPAVLFAATLRAYGAELLVEFIGKLGWLDTGLPRFLTWLCGVMLAAAAFAAIAPGNWKRRDAAPWISAGCILAALCGVLVIQYLTWTVPGAPVVDGLQGRYFLPPALMLVTLLPKTERVVSRRDMVRAAVVLFPVISVAATVYTLLLRYYA